MQQTILQPNSLARGGGTDPRTTLALWGADAGAHLARRHYPIFVRAAGLSSTGLTDLSPLAAWRVATLARRRVPAYAALLAATGWRDDPQLPPAARLARLPITDKANYIQAYPIAARCLDGHIPPCGTAIDESSGASGTPFDWVRGIAEQQAVQAHLAQSARWLFGRGGITINAFSMGAWATGTTAGEALRRMSRVKSTGPDVDKVLHTLTVFGPTYPYLITGYPPFLKQLLDSGRACGFDWARYTLYGITGGEAMSEALRGYLETTFRAVYSAYGASDLDIGVAGELPLCVWVRRQAAAHPALRAALFGGEARLPMVFQYNPLDYYIEALGGELVVTINRRCTLAPRIRYNVHDAGGVLGYTTLLARLRAYGLEPPPELLQGPVACRLPLVYVFGRSDSTLSYMGANLYPADIEAALFADPADAAALGAYCLAMVEQADDARPCVHVEVPAGRVGDRALATRLQGRIVTGMLAQNRDFRTAVGEDARAADIQVQLHATGAGPFAANAGRIKHRQVVR